MNTPPPEESYKSRHVIEMLAVANEYCLFLEQAGEYEKPVILDFISKIFPMLYLKGSLLPAVAVEDPDANERFVTQEQWENLFLTLQNKLAGNDLFWVAVPESDGQYTLVRASLAEHIADIYQDMKDFVMLYQKNRKTSRENAVSEIRKLFASHWGIRISQCHRHLHTLIHGEPEEEGGTLEDFLAGI